MADHEIVLDLSLGSHRVVSESQIRGMFSGYLRLNFSKWEKLFTKLFAAVDDELKAQRDVVMAALKDNKTYFVKDAHTLEWMAGRNRSISKKVKRSMRFSSDMKHPYAAKNPWYWALGHGNAFHIQRSEQTGRTDGGTTSIFDSLAAVDSVGFHGILIGSGDNLKWWYYIQQGTTGKMVGRGFLKDRLAADFNEQVKEAVHERVRKFGVRSRASRRR